MKQVRDLLDGQLGRVSMYRLVTLALGALAVLSIAYSAFLGLGEGLFTTTDQVVSLAVLIVTVAGTSWLIGKALSAPAHFESSVITALLLYFLFIPKSSGSELVWLAVGGVLAGVSKYLLAWRARHIFNPAAAGAFGTYLIQSLAGVEPYFGASWWIASADLLPFVAVAAFAVLWRTRRLDLGIFFVVVAGALVTVGLNSFGTPWADAAQMALETSPLLFFAGFMLSEPLTLPPRRHQQFVVAGVMALVYSYPLASLAFVDAPPLFGIGDQWQVTSLLIGNLVAFAFARRSGVKLELVEQRHHGGDTHELVFKPARPLRFEAGQYAELHVPHSRTDSRGSRRVFSVASAPNDEHVSFGLRVPDGGSSLKRTLSSMTSGSQVRATGVGGDFVLPRRQDIPVLMVAGGIGVTPFVSQLRQNPDRDAVLVYGVPSAEAVPFTDALSDARVVIVSPDRPANLPEKWQWVESAVLTPEVVSSAVPDVAQRHTFISGPPVMVNAVRPGLRKLSKRVHTDYFSGY